MCVCVFSAQYALTSWCSGGMGGMEILKRHLEQAVAAWEDDHEHLVAPCDLGILFHAVDLDPVCQQVLQARTDPPLHIFGDLMNLLVPQARVDILKVMALFEGKVKEINNKMSAEQVCVPCDVGAGSMYFWNAVSVFHPMSVCECMLLHVYT